MGEYSEIEKEEPLAEDIYTEVDENDDYDTPKKPSASGSSGFQLLSSSIGGGMKSNPEYLQFEVEATKPWNEADEEDLYTEVKDYLKGSRPSEPRNSSYDSSIARQKDRKSPIPTVSLESVYNELEREENPLSEDMNAKVNDTAVMTRSRKHCSSGPLLLSNPICREMESNPVYVSPETIIPTLTETGVEDEGDMIYDEIPNEQITPSLFMKDQHKQMKEEKDDENEDDDEELIYAPIYSFPTSLDNTRLQNILELKPENIKKIRTLGTGFFGKVILADTVGLSLKDLNISDTDGDKYISVRVAVKLLKNNKSKSKLEMFEKELKFMSRLNHPNVIRMLGACTLHGHTLYHDGVHEKR